MPKHSDLSFAHQEESGTWFNATIVEVYMYHLYLI